MPLININMYQDGVNNTDKMTSYTDQYLKESLANLGQRTGIKGDGLSISEFGAAELINCSELLEYTDSQYIKSIYDYTNHSITSYLYDIDKDEQSSISYTKYIDTPYTTTEDVIINDATQSNKIYYKGGNIYKDNDDSFYHFKFGVYKGEISDNTFNYILSNKIYNDKSIIDCINIYNRDKNNFNKNLVFILKTSSIKDAYSLQLYSLKEINTQFNYLLNEIKARKNADLVEKYIIGLSNFVNEYAVVKSGDETFKILDGSITEVTDAEKESIGNVDTVNALLVVLNNVLTNYTYDTSLWFNKLQRVYNDNVFYNDPTNADLKSQILCRMIQSVYGYRYKDVEAKSTAPYEVYFPANARFKYLYNSNDNSVIYTNTKDTNVRYVLITDEVFSNKTVFNGETIIADGPVDKTASFNFNIRYAFDDIYNDYIVEDIHSEKVYVLPYVGVNDGYWYFDDINSGIYALGKDAGQPNIIICQTAYNDPDDQQDTGYLSFKFISGVGTSILGNNFDINEVNYKVPSSKDTTTPNITVLRAALPDISNLTLEHERLRLLENALLIDLIDIRQEILYYDEDDRQLMKVYNTGYATTFWRIEYDNINNVYKYKYLVSPDSSEENEKSYALTINDLGNIENYVKHALNTEYEPDRYAHSFLVFDRIFYGNKQTITDKIAVQPVLRNVNLGTDGDANDPLEKLGNIDNSNSKAQYNNPINFLVEFSSNVKEPNNVSEILHNEKDDRCFRINKKTNIEYSYQWVEDPTSPQGGHYERINSYTYTYILNDVIYYNEYKDEVIPNSDIQDVEDDNNNIHNDVYPIVDTKEVLLRNVNTLNRTNIIGISKSKDFNGIDNFNGEIYYAYLGIVPNGGDRDILHLGTSYQNINLGAATMTDVESTKRMNRFKEFDIDIDTKFNEHVEFVRPIFIDKPIWNTSKIIDGDTTYTSATTIVHPSGVYSDIFETVTKPKKISRYITEQKAIDPSEYVTYSTVMHVDKLFNSMELSYENAIFVGDEDNFHKDTMTLDLSSYIPNTEILHYDGFTAYTVNPIQITYIDGIKIASEYIDKVPVYIYSYTSYNNNYTESWHCDGCEECMVAAQCPNRRLCKHTYFYLEDFTLQSDAYGYIRSYTENYELANQSTSFWYSYEVSVKLGRYSYKEEDYITYSREHPELYTFSYNNVIWPEGTKGTGASYWDTTEHIKTRYLTGRTINIKELHSTASTPAAQNIELYGPWNNVPKNEIWYTSTDENIVIPNLTTSAYLGANLVSNTYSNGKGILKFDGPVTKTNSADKVGVFREKSTLKTLQLPYTVKTIGYALCYKCTNLESVNIPDNVSEISSGAFSYTKIRNINIPRGVKIINSQSFSNTFALDKLDLPEGLEKFDYEVISNCLGIESLHFNKNIHTLGNLDSNVYNDIFTFGLNNVTIDPQNQYFKVDNLGVYSKDGKTFYGGAEWGIGTNYKTYNILEGTTKVTNGAFRGLINHTGTQEYIDSKFAEYNYSRPHMYLSNIILKNIIFPSTVTYIGSRVLQYGNNLESITIKAVTPPTIVNTGLFTGTYPIYVPAESVETYKAATNWAAFVNRIQPIAE